MARFRAKPEKGARLNWGDPLSRDLVAAYLLNEKSGPTVYSSIGRANGTFSVSPPSWSTGPYGAQMTFGAGGITRYIDATLAKGFSAPPITYVALATASSLSAYLAIMGRPSDFQGMLLSGGTSAPLAYIWDADGGDYNWDSGLFLTTGIWYLCVITLTASTATGYLVSPTSFVSNTRSGTHTTRAITDVEIGAERGSTQPHGWSGDIALAMVYKRAFTRADVLALASDPFRMFRHRLLPLAVVTTSLFGPNDGILRAVPSDANSVDGRLYDPRISDPAGFNDSFTGSGGLVLSGASTTTMALAFTGSDGLVLSGTATATVALVSTGSGGLVLPGTATIATALGFTPSGGLVLSGSATTTMALAWIGSGGLVLSGEATITDSLTFTPSGTLTLGGAATIETSLGFVGSGGLVISGDATIATELTFTPSGSLVLSGSAVATMALSVIGSGGLVLSGEASVSQTGAFNFDFIGSGGLVLSGNADIQAVIAGAAAPTTALSTAGLSFGFHAPATELRPRGKGSKRVAREAKFYDPQIYQPEEEKKKRKREEQEREKRPEHEITAAKESEAVHPAQPEETKPGKRGSAVDRIRKRAAKEAEAKAETHKPSIVAPSLQVPLIPGAPIKIAPAKPAAKVLAEATPDAETFDEDEEAFIALLMAIL